MTEAELNVYIQPPSSLDDSTPSSLDLKIQLYALTKKGQVRHCPPIVCTSCHNPLVKALMGLVHQLTGRTEAPVDKPATLSYQRR